MRTKSLLTLTGVMLLLVGCSPKAQQPEPDPAPTQFVHRSELAQPEQAHRTNWYKKKVRKIKPRSEGNKAKWEASNKEDKRD